MANEEKQRYSAEELKEFEEKFSHCDYDVIEVDENNLKFVSIFTKYAR